MIFTRFLTLTCLVWLMTLGGAGLSAGESAVILTADRIAVLRQRIAAKSEPTLSGWNQVHASATAALTFQAQVPAKWAVPGFYQNKEGHRKAKTPLMESADAAYALALAWALGVGQAVTGLKKAGAACIDLPVETPGRSRLLWLMEPRALRRLGDRS